MRHWGPATLIETYLTCGDQGTVAFARSRCNCRSPGPMRACSRGVITLNNSSVSALARSGIRWMNRCLATPIRIAPASAARNLALTSAQFAKADVTDFGGYDGQFNSVMDSGLLHALPVEHRQGG